MNDSYCTAFKKCFPIFNPILKFLEFFFCGSIFMILIN
jgi:hypothetical protein